MKVAYDISILGQGYINPKARTGIYRVVESLFLELIKKPELDLIATSFNDYGDFWDSTSATLYWRKHFSQDQYEKKFRVSYHSKLNWQSIYQFAVRLQRFLIHTSFKKYHFLYKPSLALQIPFKLLANLDIKNNFDYKQFHIYHSPFCPLPSELLNKVSRIITIYDLIPILIPQTSTNNIHNKFIKILKTINYNQDFVICISENTKQDFCNFTGINPNRVFVTPLAAASHFYHVRDSNLIASTLKRYAIPKSPYLLSLCTLEPRKNLSFLIKCFSKIIADNPSLGINLVLVGVNGWKNNEIFQAATKNPKLKSRIIFTGYVPDDDLSAIYSGATAFVYPSLYEGFGLPPLEAMQCGTPVITSNTSSLPEVVGDAGIMIDPKQEDELCHALLKVINDSQLRITLSQKGIERAKQFSWSKCAEETVKVYQIATN